MFQKRMPIPLQCNHSPTTPLAMNSELRYLSASGKQIIAGLLFPSARRGATCAGTAAITLMRDRRAVFALSAIFALPFSRSAGNSPGLS